jgi:phosphopentomutase
MLETAAGKDSTTGHWELAGLALREPFPTYPDGFPDDVVRAFCREAGVDAVLANRPASGTTVLDEEGARHLETGWPIVYTSADSVFQVAAHVDVVPLERLYDWCASARTRVCVGRHAVGRVIARPFAGEPGAFVRLSEGRRDLALPPPGPTLPSALSAAGIRTVSVGKVADLFAGVGFDETVKTTSNADGVEGLHGAIRAGLGRPTFVWANLVDFDQDFGHRNDAEGFSRALEAFDLALPGLARALPEGARLVLTADHGNDPTTPGTDHAREFVPLLSWDGRPGRPLGTRSTFADHAAAVAAYFGVPFECSGRPF